MGMADGAGGAEPPEPMPVQSQGFARYLLAKRSVEDRALNRVVWEALLGALPERRERPLHVLEVGAGAGVMIDRLLRWGLAEQVEYVAVELDPPLLDVARRQLPTWAAQCNLSLRETPEGILHASGDSLKWNISLRAGDIFEQAAPQASFDVLIGSALLDLLDLGTSLPALLGHLVPGGLCYFPITFDGVTIFQPGHASDEEILRLYHQTMDQRRIQGAPSGNSRTGRLLFDALRGLGADVLAAGASDWIVHPQQGEYPHDEAYFMGFILETIHHALVDHPELKPEQLESWLQVRRAQLERHELVYIAHQIDLLGRVSS